MAVEPRGKEVTVTTLHQDPTVARTGDEQGLRVVTITGREELDPSEPWETPADRIRHQGALDAPVRAPPPPPHEHPRGACGRARRAQIGRGRGRPPPAVRHPPGGSRRRDGPGRLGAQPHRGSRRGRGAARRLAQRSRRAPHPGEPGAQRRGGDARPNRAAPRPARAHHGRRFGRRPLQRRRPTRDPCPAQADPGCGDARDHDAALWRGPGPRIRSRTSGWPSFDSTEVGQQDESMVVAAGDLGEQRAAAPQRGGGADRTRARGGHRSDTGRAHGAVRVRPGGGAPVATAGHPTVASRRWRSRPKRHRVAWSCRSRPTSRSSPRRSSC